MSLKKHSSAIFDIQKGHKIGAYKYFTTQDEEYTRFFEDPVMTFLVGEVVDLLFSSETAIEDSLIDKIDQIFRISRNQDLTIGRILNSIDVGKPYLELLEQILQETNISEDVESGKIDMEQAQQALAELMDALKGEDKSEGKGEGDGKGKGSKGEGDKEGEASEGGGDSDFTPLSEEYLEEVRQAAKQFLEANGLNALNGFNAPGNLRQAVDEARQTTQVLETIYAGEGKGAGEWGSPIKDPAKIASRLKMAKSLNMDNRAKRITALFGTFTERLSQLKREMPNRPGSLTPKELSFGNDLDKVLEDELIGFVDPDFYDMMLYSFFEETMAQQELEWSPPVGNGDFVVMLDGSGSMSATALEFRGESISRWDIGLTMALSILSTLKDRKSQGLFYVFDDGAKLICHMEHSSQFEECFQRLLTINPPGGGTDIAESLIHIYNTNPISKKEMRDVIILSDGESNFNVDHLRRIYDKKGKARIYTSMIGFDSLYCLAQHQIAQQWKLYLKDRFIDPAKVNEGDITAFKRTLTPALINELSVMLSHKERVPARKIYDALKQTANLHYLGVNLVSDIIEGSNSIEDYQKTSAYAL